VLRTLKRRTTTNAACTRNDVEHVTNLPHIFHTFGHGLTRRASHTVRIAKRRSFRLDTEQTQRYVHRFLQTDAPAFVAKRKATAWARLTWNNDCRSPPGDGGTTIRNVRIELGKGGAQRIRRVRSSLLGFSGARPERTPRDPRVALSRMTTWLVLASLVVFAYGGSIQNEFLLDDALSVAKQVHVESILDVTKIFTDTPASSGGEVVTPTPRLTYRPLQVATLSAINTLFDGAAWPCHLLNLLLHLFNSVLVYAILRRLLATRPGALGLAAIFATHPAFSDSVLWVSDVSSLGASFCLLFALYIHMRKHPTLGGSIIVSTLYLAGMCFKESGLLLPVFMILYDAYSRTSDSDDDDRRIAWADYALLLAPLGIYGVLRIDAFGSLFPASETGAANPWHLFATAIGLLPRYAAELLFSFRPSLPRAVAPTATWSDPSLYGGAAIAIGSVALAFSFRKTRPLAVFGIVWMSVALLPHLVAGWPETNLFSARYLYLPAIGFLIFVGALMDFAWGTPRGIRAKRTAFVFAIGVICVDRLRTYDSLAQRNDVPRRNGETGGTGENTESGRRRS